MSVIPGVVLAAGKSSRMGRPKALLPIGMTGETFLDRIAATLIDGGVGDIVVVVGADAAAIRSSAHATPGVRFVDNPDYEKGQLTSLLAGLRAIDIPRVSAVLVTLIDVPLFSASTVRALVAAHRERDAAIVRPVAGGRHGHPVIFDRSLFDELRSADLSQGAKQVLRAYSGDIVEVPVVDEGAFTDIDTPNDYEHFIGPFPI
jgi:molybdenum cofactor cytidylyltransferase